MAVMSLYAQFPTHLARGMQQFGGKFAELELCLVGWLTRSSLDLVVSRCINLLGMFSSFVENLNYSLLSVSEK